MSTGGVTLYDLPCKAGNVPWSPNVLKTRLALNYKKIPYETEWIDLPDIQPTLESYGVAPKAGESKGASVGAQYTLPTIKLPDGKFVMDSAIIATELESLYPDRTLNLDTNLHEEAQTVLHGIGRPLFPVLMPLIRDNLITDHALPYWRDTREKLFGMSIDEFGQAHGGEKAWEAAMPGILALQQFLQDHKRDSGPFIMGKEVCYGDFIVFALLESLRKTDEEVFQRFVGYSENFRRLYDACRVWL